MSQAPPAPGKPNGAAIVLAFGGIQISEAIHFGGAKKSDVHTALLEKSHHVQHRAGKSCGL